MSSTKLELISAGLHVAFDPQNGTVQRLANTPGEDATNFVLSAKQEPSFDVEDSRFLGDLVIHTNGSSMSTGLSGTTRSILQMNGKVHVSYSGNSSNGGFYGVAVTEQYMLTGDSRNVLTWTITISNVSTRTVELEDVGLPIPMNSYWGLDQTKNYEQRVTRHSYIALDGSYVYWQTPNGKGPILLMTPGTGTSLEYKTRYGEGERFGEKMPEWEGLTEVYIHSKHIGPARSDRTRQYLPATSQSLSPGQSRTYTFNFRLIQDHASIPDALFDSGSFDIISLPGMVVPTDIPITLAVRHAGQISSVSSNQSDTTHIAPAGARKGYQLFKLSLKALGENFITFTTADNRSVVLQYFAIEPIDQLIESHSAFLAQNQLAKCDRGYNGAFLQWDMSTRKLITWDNYPGGGWREWMVGGSDDLGLAPAAYLSEKCLVSPVQKQIDAIDYHIQHFLLGYLLGAKDSDGRLTFQVYRWYDGKDDEPSDTGIWRAYNYTHVANTFFNMYRLGTAFPEFTMTLEPKEYLTLAYEVLNAMYSKISLPNPIGDAANTLGLMGESTVPAIINALASESLLHESATLQRYVDRKIQYYQEVRYPFASEMTIDTTGFESVYTFAKAAGLKDLMDKSQSASIASRGLQPLWYYYGSDNRMMGEAYWNLGYETHLGAWQQQDYLVNHSTQDRKDFEASMRSTYGAYLAGWANINSGQIDKHVENIGAAAWLWQSEGGKCAWPWMPMIGCWWAWSGEAELGFWGALRTACVNVIQHPVVGLYAYGGSVEFVSGHYIIEPRDGVQQRLNLFCLDNLAIHIQKARYSKATVAHDGSFIELDLMQVVSSPCSAVVKLGNVRDGDYEVTTSQSSVKTVVTITKSGANLISLDRPDSALLYSVTIRRK